MQNTNINNTTEQKYNNLLNYLKKLGKASIAFSGGVDSTFLLKALTEALGSENVAAITAISPYIPNWEIDEAKCYTNEMNVRHEFLKLGIIDDIKKNPMNRCYLCKKGIFTEIKKKSDEIGFNYIVDGTNYDDLGDYRPGLKALKELNILSPLAQCSITKNEIRSLSKKLKLKTWDKPPYACLLTRLPYDTEIEEKTLQMIEKSEKFLFDMGLFFVRVRVHGDLARIELGENEKKILSEPDSLKKISYGLKEIGFQYVTIDIDGYKTGSFNQLK